jgi:uncharacterized protein (DUF1330 family)
METKRTALSAMAATAICILGAPTLWAQSSPSQGRTPAYYVAEFEVTDREGIRPYAEQVELTFAPFSGRYTVRGGQMDRLEGTPPRNRMVIIAFDSLEQARAWYNSPEYAKIRPIRQRSGHTNAYIIEGLPN